MQLLFDGTNSNQATIAKGNAERIVQERRPRASPGGRAPALEVRSRAWYNPDLASRNYNVPAVIGLLLSLVCQLLTALAVVREREIGTLEQLTVSPLRPIELILGKTIPFALIALVDLVLITGMALLWFRVPLRGSPLLLLGASLLFVACALGNGLLISTISKTQQEAFLSAFLVYMPMVLLSGFMFPVASMPPLFQWLTLVNPTAPLPGGRARHLPQGREPPGCGAGARRPRALRHRRPHLGHSPLPSHGVGLRTGGQAGGPLLVPDRAIGTGSTTSPSPLARSVRADSTSSSQGCGRLRHEDRTRRRANHGGARRPGRSHYLRGRSGHRIRPGVAPAGRRGQPLGGARRRRRRQRP